MKTFVFIGKMLLKAVIVIAGFLAFFCIVGEPTDEWYQWADKMFGAFAGAWFFIEKVLYGLLIWLLCKFYELLEPDAFKKDEKKEGRVC